MTDIPTTLPDSFVELNQQKTPSHYEKFLGNEYPVESKEIGGVIIDVKKGVITLVQNAETKKETNELSSEILREVEVLLTPEEIDAIGGKITAVFKGKILIKYNVGENEIIDVTKIDINNDFGNLLSKKVSNSFFEKLSNGEIIWHRKDGEILYQNNNNFHKVFYMDYYRLKEPIKK